MNLPSWWRGAQTLGFLAVVLTDHLSAQTPFDPRLQTAIDLARAGQADSARVLVRRLLATLLHQDSTYPQALYVQGGLLAPDQQTAATSLQRVVVEYGWSSWADDALLRLAQLYDANNDPAAAMQAVERLSRDYPDSPLRAQADFFGALAAFSLRDEPRGCAYIQQALAGAGDDVEFKNRVTYYAARCGGLSPPATSPPPTADTTPRRATSYAVQVLAVKSAAQVDLLLTRLKAMGFDAHVVRDSTGLFKVRVGRYSTRDQAVRAQSELRARLGPQPFVVEEP